MNSRERSIRPVCAHNVLKARGRFGYPALARQATFQVCAFVIHFSVNFFGVDWREWAADVIFCNACTTVRVDWCNAKDDTD